MSPEFYSIHVKFLIKNSFFFQIILWKFLFPKKTIRLHNKCVSSINSFKNKIPVHCLYVYIEEELIEREKEREKRGKISLDTGYFPRSMNYELPFCSNRHPLSHLTRFRLSLHLRITCFRKEPWRNEIPQSKRSLSIFVVSYTHTFEPWHETLLLQLLHNLLIYRFGKKYMSEKQFFFLHSTFAHVEKKKNILYILKKIVFTRF